MGWDLGTEEAKVAIKSLKRNTNSDDVARKGGVRVGRGVEGQGREVGKGVGRVRVR